MSTDRLRELLAELNRELHATPDFDPDTRRLLHELNEQIEQDDGEDSTALERAQALHSRFAAEHPTAARIARELADILAKMGI